MMAQTGLSDSVWYLVSSSIDSLHAELNAIFALRKQLERDVLSYRNLQKVLEEQISEIRRREGTHCLLCIRLFGSSIWRVLAELS